MTADPVLNFLRSEGTGDPAGKWDALAGRLVDESLSGVALSLLEKNGGLDALPATARRALEADRNAVRVGQTILFDRFATLAAHLDAAGVPFIVHKGGVLAELVYERPEDRPMADIDIVFRPGQWRTVRDTLRAHGYRLPEGAGEAFWLENYFNISATSPSPPTASFDLHWGLTQEGRYHVETEALFNRAIPYRSGLAGGRPALRLDAEDLLLSLFLHLAYHYFEARLLWLYDMKRVIERCPPDWTLLRERAAEWGVRTVLAFNLSYLDKTFPGVVPTEVSRACRTGAIRRSLVRPLVSSHPRHLFRGESHRAGQFVLGLAAIDRPVDMARFAVGKVMRSLRWAGRDPHHH